MKNITKGLILLTVICASQKVQACEKEIQAFNYDSTCYSDQLTIIEYEIKAGDTLSKIAQKFNVSVNNLVEWNHIDDENWIVAGKTLRVR